MKIFVLIAFLVGMPTVHAAAAFNAGACNALFDTNPLSTDAHFTETILGSRSSGYRLSELQNNLVNYLTEATPESPGFRDFGKSADRLFLKADVQYAPLNALLQMSMSPRQRIEILNKLFASGYQLSKGSRKYPDTGDIFALMKSPSTEPLKLAIESSEPNRQLLRDYFALNKKSESLFWDPNAPINPLYSSAQGPEYANVVIAKLKMLRAINVDLTSVLEGVVSAEWQTATSAQRVQIAEALPGELSVIDAFNHPFRRNETTGAGLTALMYAISEKDLPLIEVYRKFGARADIRFPEGIDDTTAQQKNWKSGETILEYAKRLNIKLPW